MNSSLTIKTAPAKGTKPRSAPWYNTVVAWILRSPFHGVLSGAVMLITVQGRASGQKITTPVNYVSAHGGALYIVSERSRTWWRNLAGSAPVEARVRGQMRRGVGTVFTDPQLTAKELAHLIRRVPAMAQRLNVGWTDACEPKPEDCAEFARTHVLVRIRITKE